MTQPTEGARDDLAPTSASGDMPDPTPELVGHEDDGESYDATDYGDDVVPEGTEAILFAQMLVDLRDAGFPEDPDDPDGSKLGEAR